MFKQREDPVGLLLFLSKSHDQLITSGQFWFIFYCVKAIMMSLFFSPLMPQQCSAKVTQWLCFWNEGLGSQRFSDADGAFMFLGTGSRLGLVPYTKARSGAVVLPLLRLSNPLRCNSSAVLNWLRNHLSNVFNRLDKIRSSLLRF